jgi:hypothetical protein
METVVPMVIVKGMLNSSSVVSRWNWGGNDGVVDGIVISKIGG